MARSAVPVDRGYPAAQRMPARAEGESSMPTMISSATMTYSFSLPGRLSVSSPFQVLRRAVSRQARRDLVPVGRTVPLVTNERGAPRLPHRLTKIGSHFSKPPSILARSASVYGAERNGSWTWPAASTGQEIEAGIRVHQFQAEPRWLIYRCRNFPTQPIGMSVVRPKRDQG